MVEFESEHFRYARVAKNIIGTALVAKEGSGTYISKLGLFSEDFGGHDGIYPRIRVRPIVLLGGPALRDDKRYPKKLALFSDDDVKMMVRKRRIPEGELLELRELEQRLEKELPNYRVRSSQAVSG